MQYRAGLGWDSHRLHEGRPLILGGITIPSPAGLAGHSDADVLLHAITDAVLGAAALGDIGMHFPDTDPRWKDAPSSRFLEHAVALLGEAGFTLVSIDATVIIERPKLKDYRAAIRENVARLCALAAEDVSIKFKTAEGLGPVGQGLSAEAQALVTVRRD